MIDELSGLGANSKLVNTTNQDSEEQAQTKPREKEERELKIMILLLSVMSVVAVKVQLSSNFQDISPMIIRCEYSVFSW